MIPNTIVTLVVIGALFLFLYFRFFSSKGISQISTRQLQSIVESSSNHQYIDVRSVSEYQRGHIREFKNLPLDTLTTKMATLAKNQPIYVLCQSGMRSMKASQQLKKSGFTTIVNVKGGMNKWRGSTQ
ncbi:putative rhodanese domain-containing protein [Fictibacillus macauensis ZFHKF-1]|uniref:Putative rhodanese domain-containing protein n=1 Tax=Fictibacillus macauensis ZFHKF-1 TaxID=1196324 RepID=I8J4L2_9BACL|nr:rhodanese-like domain-containing protein [Fictibacillus macauensis]EIT86716.1 putative rhodanese domain-containing protein [Fictibacillus macauensis ZFHKF-1]